MTKTIFTFLALWLAFVYAQKNTETPSTTNIVVQYLAIKDALVADNSEEATKAAENLETALQDFMQKQADLQQKQSSIEIEAQKRVRNLQNKKLEVQRAQLGSLSDDIYELIKTYGSAQTLYYAYCLMKKAHWLSTSSDIKNPYYGKKMLTCGKVVETIPAAQ